MEPWYKIVQPRAEVREGRSFNPDEFAIHLEQVVSGAAPEDYKNPYDFFARTCFTAALTEHMGMVVRRLNGETANAAPVLTLVTQFGGGKTHTLTALYHLVKNHKAVAAMAADFRRTLGVEKLPEKTRVAVFVGNAWDPSDTRETPWIDIARQLAGDAGVAALGSSAKDTPPGTEALGRMIEKAGGSVLILFDEVLNFFNRHRKLADSFYAFIQNLTVAMTATRGSACVISLPRSQVEMTTWDEEWQDRISKVVRRVAKELLVNDEAEIGEVVRRRLFDHVGKESTRKAVAMAYADWCFDRRAQLPPEWTAVDRAVTEASAREYLRTRFETCYPFHPATLTVFKRKWSTLSQFQQTRGTLAMFAQWVSIAFAKEHREARREPLITIGSAPLHAREFCTVVLGQLGETRLVHAIESDIAGEHNKAAALDTDTATGPLKDLHRRVGTTILFESSGGQRDQVAHLPELRFALGEPDVDTTSIDNAAIALEGKAFYIRKAGADGYRFGLKPKLEKVVYDRRASLDDGEVKKAAEKLVEAKFKAGASLYLQKPFPKDGADVEDIPRLNLVVVDPEEEWTGDGELRAKLANWTKNHGRSPRLYPASLIWCVRKPGRELRERVEAWLAWQRVNDDITQGVLGGDFETSELRQVALKAKTAKDEAGEEVWGSYRFIMLADPKASDGIKPLDLGAGHSSGAHSLCDRILAALRRESLLNESPGAGYLERHWPEAFKESGAWPLKSLRQALLDGSLDRVINPDDYLKRKVPEFVAKGDFGLASGQQPGGGYTRLWFMEPISADEVSFEPDVYLLRRDKAKYLRTSPSTGAAAQPGASGGPEAAEETLAKPSPDGGAGAPAEGKRTIVVRGTVPAELWNRIGSRLIPKIRSVADHRLTFECVAEMDAAQAAHFVRELEQAIADLNLTGRLVVEVKS